MNLDNTTGISAVLIVEVIGKPKEHLIETLQEIIAKIKEEKGVEVIEEKIKDPTPLKDKEDFFTTFAEIEVKTETIEHLSGLIFKYMPAHIDVISPEHIIMNNNGWNEVLNEIARRLHHYDEIARIVQFEKKILEDKLRALSPEESKK